MNNKNIYFSKKNQFEFLLLNKKETIKNKTNRK